MPVTCSQRPVSTRASTERSKPRPAGPEIGHPDGGVGRAQHEVVAALCRRAREIAKQVAPAELADDRDLLAVESPRLQREAAHRWRRRELRLGDARDVERRAPRRAAAIARGRARRRSAARRGSVGSRRPTSISCPRTSTSPVVVLVSFSRTGMSRSPPRSMTRGPLDELAVHEHVLQVVVAGILPERRQRSSSRRAASARRRRRRPPGRGVRSAGRNRQPHILILLCASPCGPR